jgi:hypothetical protein
MLFAFTRPFCYGKILYEEIAIYNILSVLIDRIAHNISSLSKSGE